MGYPNIFPPQVLYFETDIPEEVAPARKQTAASVTLGRLPLVVKPNTRVRFKGKTYCLDREGRWCFMLGCGLVRNVIVHAKDDFALFRALAQIQIHGHRHNGLDHAGMVKIAQKGRLSITCGTISAFTQRLTAPLGVETRIVCALTLDEWNGYNNGHVLLEYRSRKTGAWMLMDVDMHCAFQLRGKYLSAYDFHRAVVDRKPYRIECLTRLGFLDYADIVDGRDFSTSCDPAFTDDDGLRDWHARIFQAVGMHTPEDYCFSSDVAEHRKRIETYNERNRCLPVAEWRRRFYGDES